MSREAFVTLVQGESYTRWYRRYIFDSQQRFASHHGRPLVVLQGPIRPASEVDHPHSSWEKVRIFQAEQTRRFERLCWLDADLFTMAEISDPFALWPEGWAAVDNNTYADPSQHRWDQSWYWFLGPQKKPSRLINTGFMVLHREQHAPLLEMVWNCYGGRWDQGPLSFHLLSGPSGRMAPPRFNRVVPHHLARFGNSPWALRALVAEPGLIHFAGAHLHLRQPALEWVQAVEERHPTRQARQLWEQLKTMGVLTGHRLARAAISRVEAAAPPLGEWNKKRRLRAALRRSRRLYLSPHRTVASGFVSVDVQPEGGGTEEKFARVDMAPSMPALEALAQARGLEHLVVEHLLESTSEANAAELLVAAAQALQVGGRLQVVVAGEVTQGPPQAQRAANRRYHLTREQVESLASQAGLMGAQVRERRPLLQLPGHSVRLPHCHLLLSWERR